MSQKQALKVGDTLEEEMKQERMEILVKIDGLMIRAVGGSLRCWLPSVTGFG